MLQSELSRMLFADLPHPSPALAEAVLGGSVVEISMFMSFQSQQRH